MSTVRPTPQRTPAGTPTGGQFAPTSHQEAQVSLDTAQTLDASGLDTTGRCPICRGNGQVGTSPKPCPACLGARTVRDDDGWDRVARIDADCTISCLDCNGHGYGVAEDTMCRTCDGAGTITDYSLAE